MWSRELGKQLYLGGFDAEEGAARAFDVCSLKKWRDERSTATGASAGLDFPAGGSKSPGLNFPPGEYRDLVPDRLGGAMIASHIRIADPGPVPDMVHYHKVGFQLIFCVNGWVDVVYEDQGDPIRLTAGSCFIQPPEIRHRVLYSGDDLEVI